MKKFGKKRVYLLAGVTLAVLAVMAAAYKTGSTNITGIPGAIISPVQKISAMAVSGTKNLFKDIKNSSENAKENKKLRKQVEELKSELRMVEGYKNENKRLRNLLELNDIRNTFKTTAANIIARSSSELYNTITIDKGKKDGIKKDAAVMATEGLVGVVYEVGDNYAKVKTIFDEECCVSAICSRSGDMGITEGSSALSSEEKCRMSYIANEAKIVVGDIIETAGTGGIFPRGIQIGKVAAISNDERGLSQKAEIKSSVSLHSIDTVLVSVEK